MILIWEVQVRSLWRLIGSYQILSKIGQLLGFRGYGEGLN